MNTQEIKSGKSTSGKTKTAGSKTRGIMPMRHDAALGRYFQDLSEHSVLSSEEEVEQAKSLTELEVSRWRLILSDPSLARAVSDSIVGLLTPDQEDDEEPRSAIIESQLKQLCTKARRVSPRKRPSTEKSRKPNAYSRMASELASRLYDADLNRVMIDAAHGLVLRASKGDQPELTGDYRIMARECEELAWKVQRAKHAFIRANLRLVVSIARRYDKGQMPLIDLIQEGNLGLIKAVDRFDYRRGFRFNTYASWWIRHSIGRALADKGQAVRVPVHALDAQHRLGRAVEAISMRLGRAPTEAELQKETGLDKRKLDGVRKHRVAPVTSLDREISGSDNRRYVDLLADESTKNPFENTVLNDWERNMNAVMEVLTPMERTIIRWRYGLDNEGEEMTLKEIGDYYSLSRERIRQLQEQALKKLRRRLDMDAA